MGDGHWGNLAPASPHTAKGDVWDASLLPAALEPPEMHAWGPKCAAKSELAVRDGGSPGLLHPPCWGYTLCGEGELSIPLGGTPIAACIP